MTIIDAKPPRRIGIISMRFEPGEADGLNDCDLDHVAFMRHGDEALLILDASQVSISLSDNIARVAHWLGRSQHPGCTIRLLSPVNAAQMLNRVQRKLVLRYIHQDDLRQMNPLQIRRWFESRDIAAPLGYLNGEPASYLTESDWDELLRSST